MSLVKLLEVVSLLPTLSTRRYDLEVEVYTEDIEVRVRKPRGKAKADPQASSYMYILSFYGDGPLYYIFQRKSARTKFRHPQKIYWLDSFWVANYIVDWVYKATNTSGYKTAPKPSPRGDTPDIPLSACLSIVNILRVSKGAVKRSGVLGLADNLIALYVEVAEYTLMFTRLGQIHISWDSKVDHTLNEVIFTYTTLEDALGQLTSYLNTFGESK
jgi:hypothetical protein